MTQHRRAGSFLRRRWWDFRRGELYLRLPFSFFSYLTVIYTLLVERAPVLKGLFPQFGVFVVVGLLSYPVVAVFIGRFDRRHGVLATDQTIGMRNNPIVMELLERVKRIEKIVEASP